jgi:hypothetical protein
MPMTTSVLLRAALIAGVAALAAVPSASAKPVKIATTPAPLTVEVPNAWSVGSVKRGVEIKSEDGEVFIWIETYAAAELERVRAEHDRYFEKQGVKVVGEVKVASVKREGYAIVFLGLPSTWNGAPTVLRYVMVEPTDPDRRRVMMSLWASPEGDKTHDPKVMALIDSLADALDAAK